jgi:hypothetical protein
MSFGSPPPIDQALLPASVRSAPGGRGPIQDAYRAALGFEQLLVQQLSTSLTDSAQDALGGADNPYGSLLPGALTTGVMDAGGLGLAAQLAPSLEGQGQ